MKVYIMLNARLKKDAKNERKTMEYQESQGYEVSDKR